MSQESLPKDVTRFNTTPFLHFNYRHIRFPKLELLWARRLQDQSFRLTPKMSQKSLRIDVTCINTSQLLQLIYNRTRWPELEMLWAWG